MRRGVTLILDRPPQKEGESMRPYRCYLLDDHGLIRGQRLVLCNDDLEVSRIAQGLLAEHPQLRGVEVWNRSRRIELRAADPRHA